MTGAEPFRTSRPAAEPSSAEALEALGHVLADPTLRRSRRATDFLTYVVGESLAGRGDGLSERRVGRYALQLPSEAIGSDSALVRVHATRLRKLLSSYYEGPGSTDPVQIVLPPGRYAPRFVRRHDLGREPIGVRVLVVCGPAEAEEGHPDQNRACTTVGSELRRFPGVHVFVPDTGGQGGPSPVAVDYILRSRADEAGRHRSATLVHRETGELLWSSLDEADLSTSGAAMSDEEWATRVAARLGDYSGVLLRHHLLHHPADPSAAEIALLSFCRYLEQGSAESADAALAAIDRAHRDGARTPLLLAMRASTLAAVVNLDGEEREGLLDQAERDAREAIQGDPTLGHAHMALSTTSMLRHDWDLAVRQAQEAVRLGPTHPVLLASAATVLSAAGHWAQAAEGVRRALELNPGLPPYVHAVPAIERLLAGDDQGALNAASLIRAPGQPWGPLYRALALDGLGQRARAEREMAEAVALRPDLAVDPHPYLTAFWSWQAEDLELMTRRIERLASAPRAS